MAAMTEDIMLEEVAGDFNMIPLASGAHVFQDSAIGVASGYAAQIVNSTAFAGHAVEEVDNSAGGNGAKSVKVRNGRYRKEVTLSGVAQTDLGAAVYMTYGGTYTLSDSSSVKVGRMVRYVTTDTCVVEFDTFAY